jgi:hypothetical protein
LEFTQPSPNPEDSGKPSATKERTHGIHHTELPPPAAMRQEPHVIDITVPTAISVHLGTLGAVKLSCPQGSRSQGGHMHSQRDRHKSQFKPSPTMYSRGMRVYQSQLRRGTAHQGSAGGESTTASFSPLQLLHNPSQNLTISQLSGPSSFTPGSCRQGNTELLTWL